MNMVFTFLRDSQKENSPVFVFVYYTGHGEASEKQSIVLNYRDEKAVPKTNVYRYALDENFRVMLANKPHYGIILYDCCRTPFKHKDPAKVIKNKTLPLDKEKLKGFASYSEWKIDNPDDVVKFEASQMSTNLTLIYSCPP